jgi:hypothetical protein|eukprot:COSAG02_NODE_29172_length_574_cov_1.408421_2_plen_102_part_01
MCNAGSYANLLASLYVSLLADIVTCEDPGSCEPISLFEDGVWHTVDLQIQHIESTTRYGHFHVEEKSSYCNVNAVYSCTPVMFSHVDLQMFFRNRQYVFSIW